MDRLPTDTIFTPQSSFKANAFGAWGGVLMNSILLSGELSFGSMAMEVEKSTERTAD